MLVTTKNVSYSQRVGESSSGALLGLVIIGGSAMLLWWNEHRAVEQEQSLSEIKHQIVEAPPVGVDPKAEGKVVHVSGPLQTDEFVGDEEYNLPSSSGMAAPFPSVPAPSAPSAPPASPPASGRSGPSFAHSPAPPAYEDVIRGDARRSPYVRLQRETQMYQWVEENERSVHNKVGGGQEVKTTTVYKRDWSSEIQDSARFKIQDGHENPPSIPTPSTTFQPFQASVGDYSVSGDITQLLPMCPATPAMIQANGQSVRRVGEWIYLTASANRPPQVGDVRIRFFALAQREVVSLLGRQCGTSLVSPVAGPNSTSSLPLCRPGSWTAAEMLQSETANQRMFTVLFRLVGVIGSVGGFRLFLDPVVAVSAVVPVLSTFLGAGAMAVSLPAGLGLALPTMLAAWLHSRLNMGFLRGAMKSVYLAYLVFFVVKLGQFLARAAAATGRVGLASVRAMGTWWGALWDLLRRK